MLKTVIVIAVLIILAIILLGVPLPVSGHSMDNNFQNGELVLIKRLALTSHLQRGDVVAAAFPADPDHTKLIKRVIGLPGETVSFDDFGHVTIDSTPLVENYMPIYGEIPVDTPHNNILIGANEYFLMGDNRPESSDSRVWGPVQDSDIQGKVDFVLWPFGNVKFIDRPIYN